MNRSESVAAWIGLLANAKQGWEIVAAGEVPSKANAIGADQSVTPDQAIESMALVYRVLGDRPPALFDPVTDTVVDWALWAAWVPRYLGIYDYEQFRPDRQQYIYDRVRDYKIENANTAKISSTGVVSVVFEDGTTRVDDPTTWTTVWTIPQNEGSVEVIQCTYSWNEYQSTRFESLAQLNSMMQQIGIAGAGAALSQSAYYSVWYSKYESIWAALGVKSDPSIRFLDKPGSVISDPKVAARMRGMGLPARYPAPVQGMWAGVSLLFVALTGTYTRPENLTANIPYSVLKGYVVTSRVVDAGAKMADIVLQETPEVFGKLVDLAKSGLDTAKTGVDSWGKFLAWIGNNPVVMAGLLLGGAATVVGITTAIGGGVAAGSLAYASGPGGLKPVFAALAKKGA